MSVNKNALHVLGHLELGDAVILNGLIRSLLGQREIIKWFVSPKYVDEVWCMMADCGSSLEICPAEASYEDPRAEWFDKYQPQLRLGCFGTHFDWTHWDWCYYRQAGVPFENRWARFHHAVWKNNYRWEPEPGRIFVHERPDTGTVMRSEYLAPGSHPNIVRVTPGVKTAERWIREDALRSSEIHVVDSVFLCMLDSISWPKEGVSFLFHAYAKQYPGLVRTGWPALRNPWNILL
jgi:hypothetical protein